MSIATHGLEFSMTQPQVLCTLQENNYNQVSTAVGDCMTVLLSSCSSCRG